MTDADGTGLDLVTRTRLLKTGVGFAVAVLALVLIAVGVGWREVAAALADARWRWVAVGCLATLLCLACWGRAWQVVLRVVGIDVAFRRLVVTYFAATFANYVTPLGQAGGEPFIAYVLSRDTEASYEDSLASVVTADLLNLLPFFSFAALGTGILLWQAQLPAVAQSLTWGLLAMAVGVPAIAVAAWTFRQRLFGLGMRLGAPVARRVGRFSVEGLRERLHDLGAAFDRIAADPRALAQAVAFAYLGWLFFALPLYFAGLALDLPIGLLLVFFVVPASTLAGITPSPGGLGGVEFALATLLVALTAVPAADAYALALVYRVMSYWFALAVGGAATLWVVRRA